MRYPHRLPHRFGPLLAGAAALLAAAFAPALAAPQVTPDALPFTITFKEMQYPTSAPPRVHSYVFANPPGGRWLISGGRRYPEGQAPNQSLAGLHQFANAPANNFPYPNDTLLVIDPGKGLLGQFHVTALPPALASVLEATNQQGYYDRATDYFYVDGGYGPTTPGDPNSDYQTFPTLLRFPATQVINAILNNATDAARAQAILPLIQRVDDPFLQVTGGDLFRMNGLFALVFGTVATGRYDAFGGPFQQEYTRQVRFFQINPNKFQSGLLNTGTSQSSDDYHRRDGNFVVTRDPATGASVAGVFGGVFPPGIIGAYTRPIYIPISLQNRTPVESSVQQKFGAYVCPVIVAYSGQGKATYHTFFGGISHYWLNQTWLHAAMYQTVTGQGRNDGMPFVEDITTFVRKGDGTYREWIAPKPIPALGYPPRSKQDPPPTPVVSNLRGASARFIPNAALIGSKLDADGIVQLDTFAPRESQVVGYIYGGIEAQNPLPAVPNTGTRGCNAVYQVILTRTSSPAIDAAAAHEALGTVTTPAQKEQSQNPH